MALGKGKKKNVTGTRPRKRVDAPAATPGRQSVKRGSGRRTGPKHAASRAAGQRTADTRKSGPRKTRAKTPSRSSEK